MSAAFVSPVRSGVMLKGIAVVESPGDVTVITWPALLATGLKQWS